MSEGSQSAGTAVRIVPCKGNGIDGAYALCLAQMKRTYPGTGAGLKFLDVGCGTGGWADGIGKLFPEAAIFAVDRDTSTFGLGLNLSATNVVVKECDILDGLPFPDDSIDGVLFNMVAPSLSDEEFRSVCFEIVRVSKPLALIYVSNTHHELQALIGGEGPLEADELREREVDPREDPYSLERYLRGEGVLPKILQESKIALKGVIDFQPPDDSHSRFKAESKKRGKPFGCPSIRSYICQNFKSRM